MSLAPEMPPTATMERALALSNLSMYWQLERSKRRTQLSTFLARSASAPSSKKRRGGPDKASLQIQIEFCSIALDYIQKCVDQGLFGRDGGGDHGNRADIVINTLVSMRSMLETSWGMPNPPPPCRRAAAAAAAAAGSSGSSGGSSGSGGSGGTGGSGGSKCGGGVPS